MGARAAPWPRWGSRGQPVALRREPAVSAVAGQFGEAVARHDGAAACAMLTDDARRTTPRPSAATARSQLATLPDPGAVQQVEVWGDAAQVRLAGDTVFLLRFPDGWRVSARRLHAAGRRALRVRGAGMRSR